MVQFTLTDPEDPSAVKLLGEMETELNEMYETSRRLDLPALSSWELRLPQGAYLAGREGGAFVAGGGVRHIGSEVGEVKRMFVRPSARSRGVAGALLVALEDVARSIGCHRVRLDTGPKQLHAINLYNKAGFLPIASYNNNPFASFWGEKNL